LLCSEDAGWITGQTVYADGGASLVSGGLPPAIQGWEAPAPREERQVAMPAVTEAQMAR
jgi:hypothetical protein